MDGSFDNMEKSLMSVRQSGLLRPSRVSVREQTDDTQSLFTVVFPVIP